MELADKKEPIWTRSFIAISLNHFIIFTIFYTLLTTLPVYAIESLNSNEAQGALMVTVMLASAIIFRPFSGKLLEAFGKKRVLVWSIIIYAATMLLYMFFDQYSSLLILRFLHGITFAISTTATGAIAADVIPPARRGEGLGYFAMALNVAMVLGPFAGLTLLQFVSFHELFLILGIVAAIGVSLTLLVSVPETEQTLEKEKFSVHSLFELKALPIAVVAGLVGFAYSGIVSFISVYSHQLNLDQIAGYFFIVFAAVMLLSRPVTGKMFDLKGPSSVIVPSLILFAISLYLLSITQTGAMLLLAAGLSGLGYGSLLPGFQTMAVDSAEPHRSGHATATFYTLYDTGIALGTYILGLIAGGYGFSTVYVVTSIVVASVFVLYILLRRRQRKVASAA